MLVILTFKTEFKSYFYICRYRRVELLQNQTSNQLELIYREIQLLANLMNEVLNGWLIVVLLANTTLVQSFCITTTILSLSKNEKIFVSIFFGATGIFTAISQSFMTKQMASLFVASEKTFVHLRKNLVVKLSNNNTVSTRREVRLKRRIYKSCWVIQQKFGIDNFVDSVTPLNSANIANNLTINFLLLK